MRRHQSRKGMPLTHQQLESVSKIGSKDGDDNMSDIVQKINLEQVSLEERRKEAEKPLYILRV